MARKKNDIDEEFLSYYAHIHVQRKRKKRVVTKPSIWNAPKRSSKKRKRNGNGKDNTKPLFTNGQSKGFDQSVRETLKLWSKEELDQEHDKVLRSIKELSEEYQHDKPSKSWTSRVTRERCNWEAVHQSLVDALLISLAVPSSQRCHDCGSEDVGVRCDDCGHIYLCPLCDTERHASEALHHRQFLEETGEKFYYVPPSTRLEEDQTGVLKQVQEDKFLHNMLPKPSCCKECSGEDLLLKTFGQCIVVTMKGRFDLQLPMFSCQKCSCCVCPTIQDIIRIGYWPGNSKVTPGMYIFCQDMLAAFDLLKKEKPSLSLRSWLSMLEFLSAAKNRNGQISTKVFSESLREWQHCQYDLEQLQGRDHMQCPACSTSMHACHCDGNRKVYRFKGHNQAPTKNFYKDVFIADDEDVDKFVKEVKNTTIGLDNGQCGETHWQAARTTSRSCKNLSETGLVVACCRHNILLKAVNMFQGEIFAYPLYIHQDLASKQNIRFFCQDVICKYWPWLNRLKLRMDQSQHASGIEEALKMKPFLSVMHAKSHDWTCQILWGGKWQEGAAKTTGEEMEQCNSYLSTTGCTTKNMSKGNREEQLTLHALHWNASKMETLPKQLMKWLLKARNLSKTCNDDLVESMRNCIPGMVVTQEDIQKWHAEIKTIAEESSKHRRPGVSDLQKYYRMKQAQSLGTNLAQLQDTSEGFAILCNIKDLKQAATNISVNPAEIQSLTQRLTTSTGVSEEELENLSFQVSLAAKCEDLQRDIEVLHTSIKIRHNNITRLGDSGTQRHKLRKKVQAEKARLQQLINEYNAVNSLTKSPHPVTTPMETEGLWPWLDNHNDVIPFATKRDFVEKAIEVVRQGEQVTLIGQEIIRMIRFYKGQLNTTIGRIESLKRNLISKDGTDLLMRGKLALLSQQKDRVLNTLQVIRRIYTDTDYFEETEIEDNPTIEEIDSDFGDSDSDVLDDA